jgi:hypothetical protein
MFLVNLSDGDRNWNLYGLQITAFNSLSQKEERKSGELNFGRSKWSVYWGIGIESHKVIHKYEEFSSPMKIE